MAYVSNAEAEEWSVNAPATKLFTDWTALEETITDELVTSGRKAFSKYLDDLDQTLLRRSDYETSWSDML